MRGIAVPGKARIGDAPDGAQLLTGTRSPPLSVIVRRMNKVSDNYAEMLLKHLGLGRDPAEGARRRPALLLLRRELADRGIPLAGVRVVDGLASPLRDRLTTRAIGALLLVAAWQDNEIRPAFYASLPRAGIDGTLEGPPGEAPGPRPSPREDRHDE